MRDVRLPSLHFVPVVIVLTVAATKVGAIVGGQTSCKAPEVSALEKHLPADADIVCCHSLHAPAVDSKGQPLVRCCPQPMVGR